MPALDGTWRTSTRTGTNGNCVEVRLHADRVQIRDTKDRPGPTLTFAPAAWAALTAGAKGGEFDR